MLTARRIWLTQQDNINKIKVNPTRESSKRQKRSQSHTPGRGGKSVTIKNGGNTEKLRKSTGNLLSTDTTDRGGSTKKSENNGPTKKEN